MGSLLQQFPDARIVVTHRYGPRLAAPAGRGGEREGWHQAFQARTLPSQRVFPPPTHTHLHPCPTRSPPRILPPRTLHSVLPSFCRLLETYNAAYFETNSLSRLVLGGVRLACARGRTSSTAHAHRRRGHPIACAGLPFARQLAVRLADAMTSRMMRFRSTHEHPEQFCDVQYGQLLQDPIRVVHRIYDQYGLTVSPEHHHRMLAYVAANPIGKLGRNEYRLADYGLDATWVRERYGDYYRTYLVGDAAL